jgi:hypothetical protein
MDAKKLIAPQPNEIIIIIIIIINTKISRNRPGRQRNHAVESTNAN